MTYYSTLTTPVGELLLVANDSSLIGIYFVGQEHVPATKHTWTLDPKHPVLVQASKELQEYFEGKRTKFSVSLQFKGTPFQERVWQQIALIPFGQTIHYGELAQRAGLPSAVRAAGSNTGRNPLAIVIPCHRIIGKNGGIGGFAGGLDRKRFLLGLEKAFPPLTDNHHSQLLL